MTKEKVKAVRVSIRISCGEKGGFPQRYLYCGATFVEDRQLCRFERGNGFRLEIRLYSLVVDLNVSDGKI